MIDLRFLIQVGLDMPPKMKAEIVKAHMLMAAERVLLPSGITPPTNTLDIIEVLFDRMLLDKAMSGELTIEIRGVEYRTFFNIESAEERHATFTILTEQMYLAQKVRFDQINKRTS
jgi:hypothetical protein